MDWLIWMLAGSTLALLCVVWLVVWLLIRSRAGREEAMRGQRAAQLVGGTLRFLQEVRVWMMRHTDTGEDRNAVAAGSDSDNIEKALASSTGLKTRKRKKRKKRR